MKKCPYACERLKLYTFHTFARRLFNLLVLQTQGESEAKEMMMMYYCNKKIS